MKRFLLLSSLFFAATGLLFAQTPDTEEKSEGFKFNVLVENGITSVKDQNRSSTCWSFSGLGFIESELLKADKGEYDLAEMFVVHHTMVDRAEKSVRLHGDVSFSPGGSFYDVLYCWKNYGIVPQEAMPGILYGDTLPVHTELDAVAGAYVDAIAKGNLSKLSPVWKNGLSAIYDTYLGPYPEHFQYKGKNYTPQSFAEMLGLDMDNYISLTSFSHHPLHSRFAIEIQDNWRQGESYNLSLEELIRTIDYALDQGYSVAWGADVSENGFSRQGIGVIPDDNKAAELSGSDMARWLKMSKAEQSKVITSKPMPEKEITAAMRQEAFDNWQTTDDHGMLIYGKAEDQNGKTYYMVKNSWGKSGEYNGIWYVSQAFVEYKTINILVNKAGVPKDILKSLKVK